MPQSKINSKFEFNKNKWVVSVLNTQPSLFSGGHAAIVVEGEEMDGKPFIGQYDIGAYGDDRLQANSINIKDDITNIKCFENADNRKAFPKTERDKKDSYEEKKYPAMSYNVSPDAAKKMIASIKEDKERTEKARQNGFDEKGEPIRFLKFQRLGKHHPLVKIFGDPNEGNNCAGWCLEKLAVAGIGDETGKPKPKVVSGEINCSFFTKPKMAALVVGTAIVGGVMIAIKNDYIPNEIFGYKLR